jgi:rhamnosyl/mannosyltransferase
MASGMAIVTNPETGCGEVVGDCAIKVDPEKPEEIRNALMKLSTDPEYCAELGRQARHRFEQLFTWPVIAAQYDRLYHELAANRTSEPSND